jgi:hypothetical protein
LTDRRGPNELEGKGRPGPTNSPLLVRSKRAPHETTAAHTCAISAGQVKPPPTAPRAGPPAASSKAPPRRPYSLAPERGSAPNPALSLSRPCRHEAQRSALGVPCPKSAAQADLPPVSSAPRGTGDTSTSILPTSSAPNAARLPRPTRAASTNSAPSPGRQQHNGAPFGPHQSRGPDEGESSRRLADTEPMHRDARRLSATTMRMSGV